VLIYIYHKKTDDVKAPAGAFPAQVILHTAGIKNGSPCSIKTERGRVVVTVPAYSSDKAGEVASAMSMR